MMKYKCDKVSKRKNGTQFGACGRKNVSKMTLIEEVLGDENNCIMQ